MTNNIFTVLAWLAAAVVLGAGLLLAARSAREMQRLGDMLERAQDDRFDEASWDESRLSRLEAKLARFLRASALSRRRLDEDQARIKRLVSDISHQTKTPLSSILLYTELLAERPLPEDERGMLREIGRQGEKLRFLIDALVKTSRLESGIVQVMPHTQPVRPMLEELVGAWRARAEQKGVTLSLEPGPDFSASFDAKWTAEAVGNLLDNAVKYTPAGGSVTVSARPFDLFCRISVADTGVGLTEQDQARVFERFYRAPAAANQEGVGLGLYLARQIVTAEGGYMRALRRKAGGAEFSIFLSCGR